MSPVLGLARGLWGGTGSWLGVIICLIALICQSIHLGNLQRELSLIQQTKEVKRYHKGGEETLTLCPREKRDLPGKRKRRHHGGRSVLYLVPVAFSSDESKDVTYVSWNASLQEGKAFELQTETVRVKQSGIYHIYSQVLYTDITFAMGQLVTRRAEGNSGMGEILLRCMQSMPNDKELAYNTCYTAGVFRLKKGDMISLLIPRHQANVDAKGYSTFLGLVKL
ncbi:tumor necrosis factor ligand superfamily member 13 [Pelodytes ibericus]